MWQRQIVRCTIALALAGSSSIGLTAKAMAADMTIDRPAPPGWHGQGTVVTPESSIPKPGDAGKRSHTNTQIFVPRYDNAAPGMHPGKSNPQYPPDTKQQEAPDH